jgi:dihydroorotate dehydrogenase
MSASDLLRAALVRTVSLTYSSVRPLIFARPAQDTHENMLALLARLDATEEACRALAWLNRYAFRAQPVSAGGVDLPYPLILAAGLVKGHGFESESTALNATHSHVNIMPGWRSVPALLGPVEFGSFTRWPRTGNAGTVIWRDVATGSTQNRVGLKNPGAAAAAAFLKARHDLLPPVYGINIATSPGIDDLDEENQHVQEALLAFLANGVFPSWFTLNLSCPNTEDDPHNRQTAAQAQLLCRSAVNTLREYRTTAGREIPLWGKVSPGLAADQYDVLLHTFAETGVRAVVATNTLGCPAPDRPEIDAGVGGGRLHAQAIKAVRLLRSSQQQSQLPVDIIGCGGVQDPISYRRFQSAGAVAAQYWSALVFRGPLTAATILDEIHSS